ncbi:hypothetical protein IWX62_001681 [Arthrobacter sp. CAN_A1]
MALGSIWLLLITERLIHTRSRASKVNQVTTNLERQQ